MFDTWTFSAALARAWLSWLSIFLEVGCLCFYLLVVDFFFSFFGVCEIFEIVCFFMFFFIFLMIFVAVFCFVLCFYAFYVFFMLFDVVDVFFTVVNAFEVFAFFCCFLGF